MAGDPAGHAEPQEHAHERMKARSTTKSVFRSEKKPYSVRREGRGLAKVAARRAGT
jgi:hypothetical protein